MADEWNFATTTYDTNIEDRDDLITKIDSFLTQSGWEEIVGYPSASAGGQYYLRADRLTRDTWDFLADGELQRCGIFVKHDGAVATGLRIGSYLENADGDDVQIESKADEAQIIVGPPAATEQDILMIGGEWGFYIDIGSGGVNASVAHGLIATFMPWDALNGTRDLERKFTTQGLVMDLFGPIRFSEQANRSERVVMNDGQDSNLTSSLRPYVCRGIDDIIAGSTVTDDQRMTGVGSFDSIMGGIGDIGSNSAADSFRGGCFHFGLLDTPFDDRWRISKALVVQPRRTVDVYAASTSVSNNVVALSARQSWADFRQCNREIPKIVVVGHLLVPWQLVTETVTGIQYRVVQVADDGRPFNLGIEWPGAANEVTI